MSIHSYSSVMDLRTFITDFKIITQYPSLSVILYCLYFQKSTSTRALISSTTDNRIRCYYQWLDQRQILFVFMAELLAYIDALLNRYYCEELYIVQTYGLF